MPHDTVDINYAFAFVGVSDGMTLRLLIHAAYAT
jgi:hypothetical protein